MSPNAPKTYLPKSGNGKSILEEDNEQSLPDPFQNDLGGSENLPTLVLISLGQAPLLDPPAHLAFDLRSLPNPPKHLRDTHNGTSKRLQEWLGYDARFRARRDTIQGDIEAAMVAYAKAQQGRTKPPFVDNQEEQNNEATAEFDNEEPSLADEQELRTIDEINSSLDETRSPAAEPSGYELRVGINCQMGRHRSVAMVEGFSKMSWPGWQVRVEHRDIHKKRGRRYKTGGRHTRDSRSGEASNE